MKHSKELAALLKKANPHVRMYVSALEGENERLAKWIAGLEAKYVTAQNKITAYRSGKAPDSPDQMTDEELVRIAKGGDDG